MKGKPINGFIGNANADIFKYSYISYIVYHNKLVIRTENIVHMAESIRTN